MFRKPNLTMRPVLETLEARDCPAASYEMVDLLPATGSTHSHAQGLNDNGLVVGSFTVNQRGRAAAWQIGLGNSANAIPLNAPNGWTATSTADVNNAGIISGTSISDLNGAEMSHATAWLPAGASWTPIDLGQMDGFQGSNAWGLSEKDAKGVTWIVGASSSDSISVHATVWRMDAGGGVLSRINLEPVLAESQAHDARVIGNRIFVVGEVKLPGNPMARVWELDLSGTVIGRTDLGSLGGNYSRGFAINGEKDVVGDSLATTAGPTYGFFHENGAMTSLGSLGNNGSIAHGINDREVAVGEFYTWSKGGNQFTRSAFVWQGGTMTDLKSQIVGTRSWSNLYTAIDVNFDGRIVGTGKVKIGKNITEHGYLARPVSALQASEIGSNVSDMLTMDQAVQISRAASDRWAANGFDVSVLSTVNIRIADLGGTTLGLASGHTIWLDDNAAGWGWFVDATPWDDSEFTTPGDQGGQNRVDLLSVLMHEMGHVLGFDHDEEGVMAESLAAGTRLTLSGADADGQWWLAAFAPLTKKRDYFDWWQ